MAPTLSSYIATPSLRSPLAIVFPIFAALACIMCIPALFIHVKNRNFAASVLMISLIVPNVFNFVNPLIWPTESPQNWWNGTGLCDIEVKLQVAFAAANVGAVACLFRQLAIILHTDRTTLAPSSAQRIRKRIFEIGFCVALPVYLMIAHYFVQSVRYYIYPVLGCVPGFDNSWVTIVLVFIWPLLQCVVATTFGGLAVYRLIKHRRHFAVILEASTSSITKSCFIRLFALSTSLMLVYLPLSIFTFQQNTSFARHPYSWSAIHSPDWSQRIIMVSGHIEGTFDRWIQIGTAFLVFAFFGLGQDAKALYRSWLHRSRLDCFRSDRFTQPSTSSSEQATLVYHCEASAFEERGQQKPELHQSPISDMTITLHEDEPLEKISSHEMRSDVNAAVRHSPGILSLSNQLPRKPFQEIHVAPHPQKAAFFPIWSNKETHSPVTNTQSITAKNEFELTQHTVHQ